MRNFKIGFYLIWVVINIVAGSALADGLENYQWITVPLNDIQLFNLQCEYRARFMNVGNDSFNYPISVTTTKLYFLPDFRTFCS